MNAQAPSFYTIDDLAERWGVNHKTVRAMIERGKLRHFRVGRHIRVTEDAVREHEGWNSDSSCTEATTQPSGAREADNSGGRFAPRIIASPFNA
jgi:excisionase family DNA binding protein